MNINSNVLATKAFAESQKMQNYTPIPDDLRRAAIIALAGKESVKISKTSGGKISTWAAKKRSELKKKRKKRIEKLTRKKNR